MFDNKMEKDDRIQSHRKVDYVSILTQVFEMFVCIMGIKKQF